MSPRSPDNTSGVSGRFPGSLSLTVEVTKPAVVTPSVYARRLLDDTGCSQLEPAYRDDRSPAELWRRSGAMYLSGHSDGLPRATPAPLASCMQGAWLALSALAPRALAPDFSAYQLLGERAAIAGLGRRGRVSPGGACTLLATADGMLALNLAREQDGELLPAWLELSVVEPSQLAAAVSDRPTALLVERARLLGLAAAAMGAPPVVPGWYQSTRLAAPAKSLSQAPLVVDLSSLWAGPLCAQVLAQCGARVIKVESVSRPDGARSGPPDFYHLMNAGKESVVLDLRSDQGRAHLRGLLQRADIVIESARPRALQQMGIRAEELLARKPGMVWLSITGYGRREPMGGWIAYGDDAGVAAGLSWLMGGATGDPVFCGDAIADPLTGLHAAVLAQAAWSQGGGLLLDVSLRDIAAHCAGLARPVAEEVSLQEDVATGVARPQARVVLALAAQPGEDTERILKEFP